MDLPSITRNLFVFSFLLWSDFYLAAVEPFLEAHLQALVGGGDEEGEGDLMGGWVGGWVGRGDGLVGGSFSPFLIAKGSRRPERQ